MNRFPMPLAIVATAVVAFVGGVHFEPRLGTAAQAAASIDASATQTPSMPLPDFAALVRRYGPAVVNISVTGTTRTSMKGDDGFPGFGPGDPFYRFFGFAPPQQQRRPSLTRGEGSGFVISSDGVILTNAHVVADADTVTVKLTDRREFQAKVLGTDPRTDIAVLKIDAKDLPVVELGDANSVEVGQWVVAIGAPFGFENSVTQGIVSAKSRSLPDESAVPFIQTDVAVNPGNSGGPLFDLSGRVIGINSQIFSRTGGYQGVSFAIPIDIARRVEEQLVAHGKVEHGRLGVGVQTLNQDLAQAFGRERVDGAVISKVEPGSAADKAGLRAGDVLLGIDADAVTDAGQVAAIVSSHRPGEAVKLRVWRDHREQTLSATLDSDDGDAVAATSDEPGTASERLGLTVRPLSEEERRASGLAHGLVVEDAHGRAEAAGLAPGDVLLGVNGHDLATVEDLRRASTGKTHSLALLVQRGDARIFVPIGLG